VTTGTPVVTEAGLIIKDASTDIGAGAQQAIARVLRRASAGADGWFIAGRNLMLARRRATNGLRVAELKTGVSVPAG
jgi:hypothetical protein